MDKQDPFNMDANDVFHLATNLVFKAAEGGQVVRYHEAITDILNAIEMLRGYQPEQTGDLQC